MAAAAHAVQQPATGQATWQLTRYWSSSLERPPNSP